jgi:hypothetical protein
LAFLQVVTKSLHGSKVRKIKAIKGLPYRDFVHFHWRQPNKSLIKLESSKQQVVDAF